MMHSLFKTHLFKENWKSGLTIGLVSLPLSLSLAVASGVSPISGIITAVWAGLIASIFCSSNYNIIGPTGALSGLIMSYATAHGADTIPMLAISVGFFILLAYLLRLEEYLIFIPSSVIHGFTLGVALIIGLNQINFALGLQNIPKHEKFIDTIGESFRHMSNSSWESTLLFFIFFFSLFVIRKVLPSIPGIIILSPLGILIGYLSTKNILPSTFQTLGTIFGDITPKLFQASSFTFTKALIIPALVIALIAILETMLSAKIADTMTKTKHNPRKEMLGLGLSNLISGIVGGIPATAALARTALNIKTGATHRISQMISSLLIAAVSFLFLSHFNYMPMPVIAAILVFIATNMIEREHFERLYHHDKTNFFISLMVAVITVYEDPIMGILSGSVISLLLLVNTISKGRHEVMVHEIQQEESSALPAKKMNVLIYSFKGKLVYLNSQAHISRFQEDFKHYSGIILQCAELYFIDLDGIDTINAIIETAQNRGQAILIAGANSYIEMMLLNAQHFKNLKSKGLVFSTTQAALDFLKEI